MVKPGSQDDLRFAIFDFRLRKTSNPKSQIQSACGGPKSAGLTLIELLVAIGVMAVIGNIAMLFYLQARVISKRGQAYLSELQDMSIALECLRRDVRQASGVMPSFGNLVAGPTVLPLELPGRRALYYVEDEFLHRTVVDGQGERTRRFPVALEAVRFDYDAGVAADSGAVRVTLRPKRPDAPGQWRPVFCEMVWMRNRSDR